MKPITPNSPLKDQPYGAGKPERPRLTQNALWWPAAEVYLKSTHVHDYVGHEIELFPGARQSLALDGGCEYSRVVSSGNPVYEDFSLWEDSPFELVAERLLWGTFGPKGDQPRRWVPLKKCETDHLQAILRTQPHVYGTVIERVIKHWLTARGVTPFSPIAIANPSAVSAFAQLCRDLGQLSPEKYGKHAKPAKKPVKRKACK